ncbi:MAG TPA: glycosyltransferase family 87 protein [Gemmatimonadaceae bacterium]|nr:glycosyltransferase family 87 protein [Gemmatimonadaceae bacterium]
MAALWLLAVIIVSLQASAHHNNNFEIFRTAWDNLLAGRDLYGVNPTHRDFYKYSPTFALLFAPFALLPFAAGLLLWNAANALALYWSIGRVLEPKAALAARAVVFLDTVGSMQNAQSNALSAGLMIMAFSFLYARREVRAAVAIAIGAAIKIFPVAAGVFVLFRPYRLPRFLLIGAAVAVVFVAAPLVVLTPAELLSQYRSWAAISSTDALTRGYSVMEHVHLLTGRDWPNWPVQLLGAVALLAPLARFSRLGVERFRLLFLASVLMFCVLFNHKAESPSFVVAAAGVAIWLVVVDRGWLEWSAFALFLVGTVLSASDVMPEALQENFFEPYRFKTIPVLVVWVLTQVALWTESSAPRQSGSVQLPAPESSRANVVR